MLHQLVQPDSGLRAHEEDLFHVLMFLKNTGPKYYASVSLTTRFTTLSWLFYGSVSYLFTTKITSQFNLYSLSSTFLSMLPFRLNTSFIFCKYLPGIARSCWTLSSRTAVLPRYRNSATWTLTSGSFSSRSIADR